MATTDNGRLRIEARVDTEKLRTDAAEATQILHGIGNSAIREGDAIDKSMKKIGATIAGGFAVSQLKDFVMQVAKVRGEFQQLEIAFSTMLQSKSKADDLRAISEKLEVINLQLAQRKQGRQKVIHWFFIFLCVIIVIAFAVLILLNSPYLGWDYSDPENAVIGIGFHAMEWLFTRIAPLVLIGAAVGALLTRKK